MKLAPYLSFGGQCEAAFKFYEQTLGGTVVALMPWEGSSQEADVPAEWGHKIMHAELKLSDQLLMGSDGMPGQSETRQGCSVMLSVDNATEAERIFKALATNGTVQMPMDETFWAERFGMVADQFGIPWMINCDKTEDSSS